LAVCWQQKCGALLSALAVFLPSMAGIWHMHGLGLPCAVFLGLWTVVYEDKTAIMCCVKWLAMEIKIKL
jgi:hypothetical protein